MHRSPVRWTSDNSNAHVVQIPLSTPELKPGGIVVFQVDGLEGFGLGSADSVRLFKAAVDLSTGSPVDSFSWNGYPTATYGRCPGGPVL